jgi:hypothetical protein
VGLSYTAKMKRSVSKASTATPGPLTIAFNGPHTICSESKDVLADCVHRKGAGIFFTAVQVDESYRITHIGQTGTSFYARLKEHVIQTLGGNFRICDPVAMARGENKVLWDGLWRPGRHAHLPEYLRDGPALFEAARACFKLEKAFVAPLITEDRMRRRIEGAIAKQIRKDKAASSLFPPDVRYLPRLSTETAITIRIVTPKRILGLPEQLEV